MDYLVKINNYKLPMPSEYTGTESTIVDSARNSHGDLIGGEINIKCKVEMTWNFLSASDWSNILKLFNSNYGGKFINSVTFFNQTKNGMDTKNMYVSDRTTAGVFMLDNAGNVVGYKKPKLSLIEV